MIGYRSRPSMAWREGAMTNVLIVGMGVTGEAVARHLGAERVVVTEDHPSERSRSRAAALGVQLVEVPSPHQLDDLVRHSAMVVPSPGVPAGHPVYAIAAEAGVEVVSEVELAAREASAQLLAVTGTNGKTTVTTLVAAMLVRAGRSAIAAGNIGLPLIAAVTQPVEIIVAEVSSFQLQFTSTFRPSVAVWLNLAEDHLDWHPTMAHYADAKAKVWANQGDDDVAVANSDDPVVMDAARRVRGRLLTFGTDGDYRVNSGALVTPDGEIIAAIDALPRRLPHELSNALAACAVAIAAGADVVSCRDTLESFQGLPHRVTLIGDARGVRYYDDSKATTPASVLAALAGFDSVVLVAGGRNKGLDLGVLREAAPRIRAVVAIGEAAGEVEAAFAGSRPVAVATSMDGAVDTAAGAAQAGDVVLLSPGCASFDWYTSYAERGEDFARAVRERVLGS
jgi:UDP-N-acetylmuramoylalanine--D-glutamate ligase